MQLLSGLQSNVGKTLFWQDSHLWKTEKGINLKIHIINNNNYTFENQLYAET